jgi:hypothetical protein
MTMRLIAITGLSLFAMTLTACGSSGGLFNRNRPDEMAVTRAAPLVIPPDFSLAPPQPGAPAASPETTAEQTLRALFGGAAPRSATETSLLNRAGQARAEAGIRSAVGDPNTFVVDRGTTTRDILAAPAGAGQFAQATAGQQAAATPEGGQ